MQKSAPSVGRILVMVGFALSCFGLLLFLWLAFGGPVPLKPKGYRFTVSFKEAGQLAQEADVRISGVPVGKVKTIVNDKRTGSTDATIELKPQYAPMPNDARATLRQKTLLGETYVELTPGHKTANERHPRRWPAGRPATSPRPSSSTRSSGPSTPRRGWPSRTGCRRRPSPSPAAAATSTTPSARCARSWRTRASSSRSSTAKSRRCAASCATRAPSSPRSASARGSCAAWSPTATASSRTTAARNADLQQIFQALPTFERESATTINRLTAFSEQTNPLITQLRPAARELSPTLQQLSALSPELKSLFVEPRPGDHRVEGRPPGHGAVPQGAPAAAGRARPAAAPARAAGRGPQPVPERAQRDLRELRGGHPGGGGRQALPAHDEPAEPRGRRRLPEAPADEPAQPLRVPADVRRPGQGRGQPVRDAPVHDAEPVPDGQPADLGLPDPGPPVAGRDLRVQRLDDHARPPAPPCKQQDQSPTFGLMVQYPHVPANTRLLAGAPFTTGRRPGPAPPASVPGG